MSAMLRSASIKAKSFAEAGSRIGGRQVANSRGAVGQVRFNSFDSLGGSDSPDGVKHDFRFRPTPLPLPAVAYDYDYDDDTWDGDNDVSDAQNEGLTAENSVNSSLLNDVSRTSGADPMSFVGGRPPPTTNAPYPPPSAVDQNGNPLQSTRKTAGGGGGGGGRHRCPKCGTYTIFSHNEFGNSFYCATCSGWFTAAETMEGDENLMKVRRNKKEENRIAFIYWLVGWLVV